MNDYTAVTIGWINDLGFCPQTNGVCQIQQFAENYFINAVLDPNGPGLGILGAYVYPTAGCTAAISSAGGGCTGSEVHITNLGCASAPCSVSSGSMYPYFTSNSATGYGWPYTYTAAPPTGWAAYWYCGDEGYAIESTAALSYGYGLTSTANSGPAGTYVGSTGYSGAKAYNTLRAVAVGSGCATSSFSPKWDIVPRM